MSLETKINGKHLDVDTQLPDDPVQVWGDPDAITQVCYNLLDNAIKFSYEESTLGITVTTRAGKAYVSVRNHGDTIPPDRLPLVFDRFHKTDHSRSVDREGVGLGLYIVKTVLNNHHEKHHRDQCGRGDRVHLHADAGVGAGGQDVFATLRSRDAAQAATSGLAEGQSLAAGAIDLPRGRKKGPARREAGWGKHHRDQCGRGDRVHLHADAGVGGRRAPAPERAFWKEENPCIRIILILPGGEHRRSLPSGPARTAGAARPAGKAAARRPCRTGGATDPPKVRAGRGAGPGRPDPGAGRGRRCAGPASTAAGGRRAFYPSGGGQASVTPSLSFQAELERAPTGDGTVLSLEAKPEERGCASRTSIGRSSLHRIHQATVAKGTLQGVSQGTGILMSRDGYLITNAHVIDGAFQMDVSLEDGRGFRQSWWEATAPPIWPC